MVLDETYRWTDLKVFAVIYLRRLPFTAKHEH